MRGGGTCFSTGERKGKPLGQLRSLGSLAMLATIILCMLTVDLLEFKGLFQIGGLIAALGGRAVMFVSTQLQTERRSVRITETILVVLSALVSPRMA